ncbi:MAG: CHAT domain-containing protein [Blastocatellia bacterium]|nr:CHAT domain-containing protein [Blastocatellia bacterium]
MTRFYMKHSFLWLFVIGGLPGLLHAQEPGPLEPGKTIERDIASGQTQVYRLALTAGQFVHFTVEQLSCDVTLTLTTPDGKQVVKANLGVAGLREALSEEATMSGDYQLALQNDNSPWLKGSYRLQMDVKSTATAQDRKRIQAERGLIEHKAISNPQQALEKLPPILQLWREIGDRYWEGVTLGAMAFRYQLQQNWAKGEEHAEQAVAIMRELKMPVAEAWYLQTLAFAQRSQQRIEQPLANLMQALALARQTNLRNLEAIILGQLGGINLGIAEYEKAGAYYEQARAIHQELGNVAGETSSVNVQGLIAQRLKKYDEAQKHFEAALAMARNQKNKSQEASILQNLAQLHNSQNQFEQAVLYYEQAIQLQQELKATTAEAGSQQVYGLALRAMKQYEKSVRAFERVLTIRRANNDKLGEGVALTEIGLSNIGLGLFEKASECFEKALQISAEIPLVILEDRILSRIGTYSANLQGSGKISETRDKLIAACQSKNYSRAESLVLIQTYNLSASSTLQQDIGSMERAAELARQNRNQVLETNGLYALSDIHERIADYEKSVKYLLRSLEISREIKDPYGEISSMLRLGRFYGDLGHHELATQSLEQALTKTQDYQSIDLKRDSLMDLGQHYARIGSYDKVIAMHDQSLAYFRKYKQVGFEISQLCLLAKVYIQQRDFEKSLGLLQQAYNRTVELKAEGGYPYIQYLFGEAYRGLKQYELAISHHQQSIQRTTPNQASNIWNPYLGLMKDYEALNLPQPAIFWGKQAVNTIQGLREKMVNLDRGLQQSFLKSKEDIYRSLADLLIANGRLPEAEQVIRMLKDEEYFDYIRRDTKNGPKGEKASLTPEEQAAEKRYREIADQLAGIGAERSALLSKNERSAEEEQRLAKLETDLTVASQVFQKFLDQLNSELHTRRAGDASVAQLNDSQAFMDDLREMGKGAVALYTVVSEDKFHVILTTPGVRKSYSYPIKAAALNRKVLAFREVLQNPKLDPLPLAQELYKILVAPLAKDLQAAKAETLMWSLDGVLRYVPMAALHDGDKYLVERWRNVVFTAASKGRLKDDPSRNWRALGLGVTKAHGATIPALPAVADEMRGIIRESGSKTGVLPGAIKLDEQFTQEAMLTGLRQRPSVVHVASHFQFQPGNETNSALLLGDGQFLSLANIKSLPNVFSGVELLTLSACNTAMGSGSATGKEIEGFGMLAQNQGAKAVVASLWPVADRSTKELMQKFYQLREVKVGTTKAEALQQAQGKLLHGEIVATVNLTQRDIVHETDKRPNLPKFKADPKTPYAHPYYWAPFILIGNWK